MTLDVRRLAVSRRLEDGSVVRTGRERPVGCAASRLRSGSLTRLRSAAKRRNQPQISHIRKTPDKLKNLSQDLTRGQTDFAQAPVCQLFSTVLLRAESWQSGALRLGRGGTRFPHFWPGVRSVWPWLGGLKGPSRRPSAEHGRPEVRLTLGASA